MVVTNLKTIVIVILMFIFETHSTNCGPRHYTSSSKSSEDSDTSLENIHPGKPLKARKQCNVDWVKTYKTDIQGYVPVDCGRCSIYNINVLAWRKTTDDNKVCCGLTPDLFSSSQDCMWKNNCILRYVPAPIVWSPPKCTSCIGEEPGTFDAGYSCLDADIQIDDVMKGFQIIESEHGLVRSHNYDARHREAYPRNLNKYVIDIAPPGNLSTSWKDYYYAMLFVVTSNISQEDKLSLSDNTYSAEGDPDKCEISTWRTGDIHNVSFSNLHFKFALGSTRGLCTGFDICFQWFEQGNKNAQAIFNETVKSCIKCTENKNGCPTFDVIKDTTSQETRGIIRSHSKHPWNYPRPERTRYSSYYHTWTSHLHVLISPNTRRQLEVEVQRMDIGWGDKLVITDGNKRVSEKDLGKASLHYFRGQNVTLNFSVYHSTIRTGSGFLLCYQWSTSGPGMTRTKRLCDDFAYPVKLEPYD